MESKINRITDILRRDDGISGAMHYTEQISWILFLKFLNDLEETKNEDAELDGETYNYILDEKFRWNVWGVPKLANSDCEAKFPRKTNGKIDVINSKSGEDLLEFVNNELFPYLKSFKNITENPKSIKYKIGAIFEFLDNKIANGHTLREVLDIIDEMDFHNQSDLFQLSLIYEKLLKDMGSDGGNSGEFYTPRPLIKVIADVVNPQIGDTIYDPAVGSCGFLIEAYNHIRYKDIEKNIQNDLSVEQLKFLHVDTFFGNEKTPLSYVMGVMNMILHSIESPNISKSNTLTKDIRGLEEKDRYDCILANPPFGGKEKEQIQQNFPIKSAATEVLFLQHMMNHLKLNGKCGVVIPEGLLANINTSAYNSLKKELLERFNLHTVLSLPIGVFLPYTPKKTNVLFFDRNGSTSEIYYYEVNPPYKLTKKKPIEYSHFKEFLDCWEERKITKNSWIVNVNDLIDYNLSAKNPNKSEIEINPFSIIEKYKDILENQTSLLNTLEEKLLNLSDSMNLDSIDTKEYSFDEIFNTISSKQYQIKSKDYLDEGLYPIVDQSQKFIVGYYNDDSKLFKNENNVIVFGDHTKIFKYIDFDFVVGADGTKLLSVKNRSSFNLKYLYYYLLGLQLDDLGYSRHFKLLKERKYNIPTIDIQNKVVESLSELDDLLTNNFENKKSINLINDYFNNSIFSILDL